MTGSVAHGTKPIVEGVALELGVEVVLRSDGHLTVTTGFQGDVDADPLGYIRAVKAGMGSLESTLDAAVHAARRRRLTWEEIGGALGVTRQSAWERYAVE